MSVYSSAGAPDRKWETELEAGAGGGDGERPAAVWQFTTEQGGLAQPHAHLPTPSNTVGSMQLMVFSSLICKIDVFHLMEQNRAKNGKNDGI